MRKFTKCNKCWREYMWFRCPNWCDEIKSESVKDTKQNIPKVIKQPEVKLVEKKVLPKQVETSGEMFQWIKLYTASYLNNKLNININSIKKQTSCIKYKWKYLLHKDIIQKFKNDYLLTN